MGVSDTKSNAAIVLAVALPFSSVDHGPRILLATPLAAQTETIVSDRIACVECYITLTPITTLGKLEDEVAFSRISNFAIDPSGYIYAGRTYLPGTIAQYDFDGNLVSTFGRPGRGPGEFQGSPLTFVIRTDEGGNVHVVESDRRTVVRAGLGGLIRTHRVPASFSDATVLDGGKLLVSLMASGSEDEPPLLLMDSLGVVLRRFGVRQHDRTRLHVAPAPGGGFWVSDLDQYRLEEYGPDGSLQRVVRREPRWFPPRRMFGPRQAAFSTPTLSGVYDDGEGRLWTLTRVPATDRARADAVLESGAVRLDQLNWSDVQDTRIEVIDLESGVLLASAWYDGVLHLLDGGFVVTRQETPEGLIQAVVSSVALASSGEAR